MKRNHLRKAKIEKNNCVTVRCLECNDIGRAEKSKNIKCPICGGNVIEIKEKTKEK